MSAGFAYFRASKRLSPTKRHDVRIENDAERRKGMSHRVRHVLYAVSARETVRGYSGREDFWFIVAIRSEDEAEIRAGETAGGSGREGPPACDAPAVLGRGEDPHRARGPAG